jgi:hypothetical protein
MKRKTIRDTPEQTIGTFGVFRHRSELKQSHFASLHDTYKDASAEAVRLLGLAVSNRPDLQSTYYVVEIAGVFSAGKDGLHSQER